MGTANSRPIIRATVRGSGSIDIASVGLNSLGVPFIGRDVSEGVEVQYRPAADLPTGLYRVEILARNMAGGQIFEDTVVWEFALV
jgi:hypothetical protein